MEAGKRLKKYNSNRAAGFTWGGRMFTKGARRCRGRYGRGGEGEGKGMGRGGEGEGEEG